MVWNLICSLLIFCLNLAKERPVGWYHTGPKLKGADLKINELFRKYSNNPVLVIVDPVSKDSSLPINSYIMIDEIHDVSSFTLLFASFSDRMELPPRGPLLM